MPRPKYDWPTIRAEYEAGETVSALARKFGCARRAIQQRIQKEGWAQDVEPAIRRKVAEKVAGVIAGATTKKKAAAMDAEATRRAAVVARHQVEWEQVAALRQESLKVRHDDPGDAFQRAKLAKITAEMTAIQQAGERKAWNLDADPVITGEGIPRTLTIRHVS